MVTPNLLALVGTPNNLVVRHNLGPRSDGDGDEFGPPVAILGRWEDTQRQMQIPEGRVVVMAGIVYLPAAAEMRVGDKVLRGDVEHRVEMVDAPSWFDGTVMHYEVYVS